MKNDKLTLQEIMREGSLSETEARDLLENMQTAEQTFARFDDPHMPAALRDRIAGSLRRRLNDGATLQRTGKTRMSLPLFKFAAAALLVVALGLAFLIDFGRRPAPDDDPAAMLNTPASPADSGLWEDMSIIFELALRESEFPAEYDDVVISSISSWLKEKDEFDNSSDQEGTTRKECQDAQHMV